MLTTVLPLRTQHRRNFAQRLLLKEVFLQLLLLKLFCKQYEAVKFKFVFKYKTRYLFMTTRAPYRYKLTRNQYLIERYHYAIFFSLPLSKTLTFSQFLTALKPLYNLVGALTFLHGDISTAALSLPVKRSLTFTENGWI